MKITSFISLVMGAIITSTTLGSAYTAKAQDTEKLALSADTEKLLKHLRKRYDKGPISLDRGEELAEYFAREGDVLAEDSDKPSLAVFRKSLKHEIEGGPFIWGARVKPWTLAGKRVREICEEEFKGSIDVLSVKAMIELERKGQAIPIPSRGNETIHLSALEKVIFQKGRQTYNTSNAVGIYSCMISGRAAWSTYVDKTRYAGGYRTVGGGDYVKTQVMAILPLDKHASPVLEAAIYQDILDRLNADQDRKMQALKNEVDAARKAEEAAKQAVLDRQAAAQAAREKALQDSLAYKEQADFQAKIEPGMNSNCGMIVEVKKPVVFVQPSGLNKVAQWVNIDDIDVPGRNCSRLNIRGYK